MKNIFNNLSNLSFNKIATITMLLSLIVFPYIHVNKPFITLNSDELQSLNQYNEYKKAHKEEVEKLLKSESGLVVKTKEEMNNAIEQKNWNGNLNSAFNKFNKNKTTQKDLQAKTTYTKQDIVFFEEMNNTHNKQIQTNEKWFNRIAILCFISFIYLLVIKMTKKG